jgi:presenilin-like A22 family membrane protease
MNIYNCWLLFYLLVVLFVIAFLTFEFGKRRWVLGLGAVLLMICILLAAFLTLYSI